MCGIAGAWDPSVSTEALRQTVKAMTHALLMRGPDGQGLWSDAASGVALGHQRLSVIDLTEAGEQPMVSESGRYVLSYNGEIYNQDELLKALGRDARSFRGHSDTEVALATIERFGIAGAVQRFNGMFALAIWDREERRLSLVRDRLGIKPLFYGSTGRAVLFGSQASVFRQHSQFDASLDPDAVAAYLRASCVPAPLCIYRNAKKVMPGTIVHFGSATGAPRVEEYWDALAVATAGQANPRSDADPRDLVDELDALLTDSVRRRLISDVPLGAFLSGGIDSSTVVALMRKVSNQSIKTFTIGTQESSHDESSDARVIAEHLGTDHHELIATPQDALAVVPHLSSYYDEPFADSSQIPTYLVSQLARRHVTVSLSGDGGDELFGGYNRHIWGPRVAKINRAMPGPLRRGLAASLLHVKPRSLDRFYETFVPKIGPLNMRLPSNKALKFARAMSCRSQSEMYDVLVNSGGEPASLLNSEFYTGASEALRLAALSDVAHAFMFQDMIGYLPNDILTKVDRASMAVSLEARVPLLDHRVVEFAWSLPLSVKHRDGLGKWVLRQVLDRYVPSKLMDRPKSGFGVPIDDWVRGPLRSWGNSLVARSSDNRVFEHGRLDVAWQQYLGQSDGQGWNLLMLLDWLEKSQPTDL